LSTKIEFRRPTGWPNEVDLIVVFAPFTTNASNRLITSLCIVASPFDFGTSFWDGLGWPKHKRLVDYDGGWESSQLQGHFFPYFIHNLGYLVRTKH
jgi:hypothetical protein